MFERTEKEVNVWLKNTVLKHVPVGRNILCEKVLKGFEERDKEFKATKNGFIKCYNLKITRVGIC